MKAVLFDQERQTKHGENSKELDRVFHPILSRTAGNSILYKIANLLNDFLEESHEELYQSEGGRKISFQAHLKIFEAIEKKDPGLAWQEMNHHLIGVENVAYSSPKNLKSRKNSRCSK